MNKYINRKKKNIHEEAVRSWFEQNGYNGLARGWPDFVFWKGQEIIFVEVKPPHGSTIKTHQYEIKRLLESLGATYKVAFSVNDDGSPNFKDLADGERHTPRSFRKPRPHSIW